MKEVGNKGDVENLLEKNKYVFMLFYADWCMLGRALYPIVEQVEKHFQKEVAFAKVNIEKNKDLKKSYKVISLPMIIIIEKKKVKRRLIGLQSKKRIKEALKKVIISNENDTKKGSK